MNVVGTKGICRIPIVISLLALTSICIPLVSFGIDNLPVSSVQRLKFVTLPNSEGLTAAEDQDGNTWIRGSFPTDLIGVPVVFQIPTPRIHDYRFYIPVSGELKEVVPNTDSRGRYFKSRFPQYTMVADDTVYYIMNNHQNASELKVTIQERDQFLSAESIRLFRIGLYCGLAVMSVVFNVVFYLVFRDKRFITYCLLLMTTFISFFFEDGMFYYFSDGRWTMDYLTVWNSSITAIAALMFTYYFLGLEQVLRSYRKWYYIASVVLLMGAFAYTLTRYEYLLHTVLATCFLFALTCLYLAVRRFKHDVYARFLVLAFSLVVLTGILYVLHSRLDSTIFAWFDINTFRLMSSIEIIGISFAIIFKVKALQHENDRYREALDHYLKTLELKAVGARNLNNKKTQSLPLLGSTKQELAGELKTQYELTDREIDVLLCIWDGLTNKEIAERLFITLSTTKYHVSNLYVKLEVKNRNQVQVLRKMLWDQEEGEEVVKS